MVTPAEAQTPTTLQQADTEMPTVILKGVAAPCERGTAVLPSPHPGGNPGANLEPTSHRCHLFEVAFVWGLTKQIMLWPLGCFQGGSELGFPVTIGGSYNDDFPKQLSVTPPGYKGTSLIRNCPPPHDRRRVLGIGLQGPGRR